MAVNGPMALRLSQEDAIAMTTLAQQAASKMDALIDDIRAILHRPLRLRDLEAQTFYSRRWLNDAFRRRFDRTPMQCSMACGSRSKRWPWPAATSTPAS
jgi:transcriptional regulator GlxA family with amidase domain